VCKFRQALNKDEIRWANFDSFCCICFFSALESVVGNQAAQPEAFFFDASLLHGAPFSSCTAHFLLIFAFLSDSNNHLSGLAIS
jgi:hypothetical protein